MNLPVIIREDLKFDNICINTSLKLHREVGQLEAPDPRFVDARSEDELPVLGDLDGGAHSGHVEILDELHTSPDIQIFALQCSSLSVREPLE